MAEQRITVLTIFDFDSSVERKNPAAAVEAFQAAFKDDDRARLVVKTANVSPLHWGNALQQWERVATLAKNDSRITIIDAYMTESQLAKLMAESDVYISTHRAEGFGYTLADALLLEIPVVCTNYSGNVDFCDASNSFPVDFTEIDVPGPVAYMNTVGAKWADVHVQHAAEQLRAIRDDPASAKAKAQLGRKLMLEEYSPTRFAAKLRERIYALCGT